MNKLINQPMTKYPHQEFIETNSINTEELPDMLRKRIIGFEELQDDLKHTTGSDNIALQGKLDYLSHQLEEDLEEYFEEQLENNELEDVDVLIPETTKEKKETAKPVLPSKPRVQESEPEISIPEKKTKAEPDNEAIIEKLIQRKKDRIFPAELKAAGFKGNFTKTIITGKFCLKKGKYENCYRIQLTPALSEGEGV